MGKFQKWKEIQLDSSVVTHGIALRFSDLRCCHVDSVGLAFLAWCLKPTDSMAVMSGRLIWAERDITLCIRENICGLEVVSNLLLPGFLRER